MDGNRRREERLENAEVTIWLRQKSGATICDVLNVSRLGAGISLPEDCPDDFLPPLKPETVMDAVLRIRGERVSLGLRIVRIEGSQIGCSFEFRSDADQMRVFQLLSPLFVAQSIKELDHSLLGPDILYAFSGHDFFVAAYKAGRKYRICTLNREVSLDHGKLSIDELEWGAPHAIDPRIAGCLSVIPVGKDQELQAIDWIRDVMDGWAACPPDLREALRSLEDGASCSN